MKLNFRKLDPKAFTPTRAYPFDSGLDVYSIKDTHIILPQQCSLVETGLSFQLPEPEKVRYNRKWVTVAYELQARSKSGLALKNMLGLGNGVGTIDSGYTGEVKGIMFNYGTEPQEIKFGQKIFQLVLCPVIIPELVEEQFEDGDRGFNGYGSTGV